MLAFDNAAVAAGVAKPAAEYLAAWSRFDNATGATQKIADTQSATPTMQGPRDLPAAVDSFVQVEIAASSAEHPSWSTPVRVFFRRTAAGWVLVGLERQ